MRRSNLRKIARELTPERVRFVLEQGRGEMASFAGVLSDAQMDGVAKYLLLDLLADDRLD